MQGDEMLELSLERGNIERQLPAPVVHTIPIDGPFHALIPGKELGFGQLHIETVLLCITLRDIFAPKFIIEAEIEEGTVHVQEHGFNILPRYHGG